MVNPKTPEEIQEDQEALQKHKETLRVYWTSTGYVVDFTGTADEKTMQDLFGTHVLPTGFTAECPPSIVLDGLQKLNPQYRVEVF